MKKIRTELEKYSSETLDIFFKTLPCINPNKFLEIWIVFSYGGKSSKGGRWNLKYFYPIHMSSIENFWKRWNRFKKIKAFT